MKRTASTLLLFALAVLSATGQNPVIRHQFTADPTARVFDGKVYLYPSHDIVPPAGQRADWFCMADYHVFSSTNLTDWTDHGVIVTQNAVPWVRRDSYAMWAPDCVRRQSPSADGSLANGKYYFYFPAAPKAGFGFAIGVATADSPEGPFVCEPEPIRGVSGIDPCVLVDDDGQAYIYWSGMGLRGARLSDDMLQLKDPLSEVQMPRRNENDTTPRRTMLVGGQPMEGLPDGFKEGPFVFRRGQHYYLTFPWVRREGGTETLAYAMSDRPLGPWTFKGIIMAEHPNGCWTNHHSIVEYQGQWYLFYHTNFFSPSDDKRRSVCIERLSFRADGTIGEIKETIRGVGINKATERIDIDRFSTATVGVSTQYVDTADCTRGACVNVLRGGWVTYADVDFSCLTDGYLVVSAKAADNTEFCIRENGPKGKVIARVPVTVKSQNGPFRRDQSGQWLTLTAPLQHTPKGVVSLCVTAGDADVSIDWVQFKNRPRYFTPVAPGAAPSQPDEQGFIRRWMLLEPIRQDVRSNTVFTNTWLGEVFSKTWFKDQLTLLPRDGQKVKAAGQTLRWHALDSENYNVKLFRFAERWGQQTYGSLFWAVTVVECPEDIPGVRLAAGSNGASQWWLNGEPVLLLEGDRRMVEDDGMSARLTLKKGRNVLRCAVVNGPGLSDMCVRFIDEQGQPVTNFNIK